MARLADGNVPEHAERDDECGAEKRIGRFCGRLERAALIAAGAGHQPVLFARWLDRVAAAQAVGAVVIGVERVCNVPGGRSRVGFLTRSPAAAAFSGVGRFSQGRRSRRRGCLLGPGRFPRRHHVRRGRYRISGNGSRGNGRRDGSLCLKAAVPGCGANARVQALRAIRGPAARPQVLDFYSPAAAGSATTWNAQRFAPLRRFRLVVFEAGEDTVDVVRRRPVWRDKAALRRRRAVRWSIDVSQQSAIAGAIDLPTFGASARKTILQFNGLSLSVESPYPQGLDTIRSLAPKLGAGCAFEPSRLACKPRPNLRLSAVQ